MRKHYKNVDEYIADFPADVQKILSDLRRIIRKTAPEAEEVISYNMPAYKQNSILVYFAAFEHHIGFYPTPSGISAFKKDIAEYKSSKGAIQFPLNKPLPVTLIKKVVEYRIKNRF